MLSVVEQKKEKKVFWSFQNIGIAASFLLFCTLGFWLYNQNNTDEIIINGNNVVTKENNIENRKDTLKVDKPIINQEKFISKPAEAIVDNSKKQKLKKNPLQ
ncbi:MAG: hypothetical protein HC854_15200 [Flavobacterium sp.]|nr:hypothetical protein [Flavobacterium sp.]